MVVQIVFLTVEVHWALGGGRAAHQNIRHVIDKYITAVNSNVSLCSLFGQYSAWQCVGGFFHNSMLVVKLLINPYPLISRALSSFLVPGPTDRTTDCDRGSGGGSKMYSPLRSIFIHLSALSLTRIFLPSSRSLPA